MRPLISLLALYLLAKVAALFMAMGALSIAGHPASSLSGHEWLASLLVLVLFLPAALQLAAKAGGLPDLRPPAWTTRLRWLHWLAIAVLTGIVLRWGVNAAWLGTVWLVQGSAALEDALGGLLLEAGEHSAPPPAIQVAGLALSAVDEELFYRGLFFLLCARSFGVLLAMQASSVLFAVPHLNPLAFFFGLGLLAIYLLSGRLWVAIVTHVALNLAVPVGLLVIGSFAIEAASFSAAVGTRVLLVTSLATAVLAIAALLRHGHRLGLPEPPDAAESVPAMVRRLLFGTPR